MKLFSLLLLLMMFAMPVQAETALQEVVLFDDEAVVDGSWQLATGVNTTNAYGDFDASQIAENGYFTVEYTGTMNAVYLALSEWQSGVWASMNTPASCVSDGELLIATFTFEQCCTQFGSADFSAVDQICAGSTNSVGPTVIRRIIWHGVPVVDESGADAILFKGSATARAANSNLAFCFTKHVGGDFDAAQIGVGARVYAEYSGAKNGVYLALSSHSGAKQWARVNASEIVELGNNRFAAYFDYVDMVRSWGNNFARLDQFSVFSSVAQEVTLHKLAYFSGDSEPTDRSVGRWDRPDTGIAFIGDSICQNALLLFGDWNTILHRADCCNYGIGGQTTEELALRIDELARRQYHMVVFICGINDIGRAHTNEEIIANFDAMISKIRATNPDCEFLLVSVLPTTSAFYAGQQSKIVQLNAAYEEYAAGIDDVTYVDVYSAFTSQPGEYAYPELLSDGLHPNREGYDKMAAILSSYLPEQE